MKSVLLVLALVLSAATALANEEQTATAAEVAAQELQQLQNPFPDLPQAVEDEADETEDQNEGEADSEDSVSLAELAAETKVNEDAVAKAMSSIESESDLAADVAAATQAAEEGPNGRRRRRPKKRPIIAPAPLMQPVKFHSERIEARSANRYEDPEMGKLNLALAAVKEDILSTNKQITDERKWVIAVAKIIASYNDKMKRVEAHIIALRKEMKALYRKKKQIENLKLQKALEAKLKEARDELSVLTNSLKHVAVKQGELNRSGMDLRQTIAGIQAQLAKLRGQQLRKPRPAARGRRGRKGRKGGKRCKKGMRFSRKAKRCVPKKGRKAGRR
jgi:hypothetical protein